MLTRGLRVDVEFNLPSSQTVAFIMNVWLNLVCLNAPLDTLHTYIYHHAPLFPGILSLGCFPYPHVKKKYVFLVHVAGST